MRQCLISLGSTQNAWRRRLGQIGERRECSNQAGTIESGRPRPMLVADTRTRGRDGEKATVVGVHGGSGG